MSKEYSPTAAQIAAITTHHKTLLISAAAGSGKTSTLAERILQSISDKDHPADISKMLIVTFTRSAAEELKTKIFQKLSQALAKNPNNETISAQLVRLGSAHICTIDSFCLDLLSSNFSAANLSASFRLADETELALLSKAIMEEVVNSFYENNADFPGFAECLTTTRSASSLTNLLIDLAQKSNSIPEGIDFFRSNAQKMRENAENKVDFFSTSFGKIIRRALLDEFRHIHSIFEAACDEITEHPEWIDPLFPAFERDRTFCETMIATLQDENQGYAISYQKMQKPPTVNRKAIPKEELTEEIEELINTRETQKKKIADLKKAFFAHDAETILRLMKDTANYIDLLYSVLHEYEERLTKEKNARNILSFSDLRRKAFQLLVDSNGNPTELAKQYAEEFSDIYIDEYQDVDSVQDQIFKAISRPDNRFMVGDIKQSIYGFRGAEPKLFSNYRNTFPDHDTPEAENSDTATIFMSENFRCNQSVIDFTNLVCGRIFSACTESLNYQKKDDLVFSKKEETAKSPHAPIVQVTVISTNTEVEEESDDQKEPPLAKELEAAYIAEEIDRLIHEEGFSAGEIAVLFRSHEMSPYVANALKQRGIPSSESDSKCFFQNPDVLMILCLLNTIDNPHRDIFLTGTLRSPLFEFDINDLIDIRKAAPSAYSLYDALLCRAEEKDELGEKCLRFHETLQQYRNDARAMPVDRFLRTLFESDRMIATGLMGDGSSDSEGGNLLRLYDYARSFENGSFKGLYNFIEFINSLIEDNKKIKIPSKGKSSTRVNLMTIHSAKGLEFRACFVCGASKQFNTQDQKAPLLFEYPFGVAMNISDSTSFARIRTPMHKALALQKGISQTEEEMRLLYVALTRAVERLYVTASTSKPKEFLQEKAKNNIAFCDRYTLLHCKSYIDWILLPFVDPNADISCANISFLSPSEIHGNEDIQENLVTDKECEVNEELRQKLETDFAFQYPYRNLQRIPAKISVSRLSPNVLDESDDSVDMFSEKKTPIPDFFLSDHPSAVSPSERGTATHLFLQFCDFEYAKRHGAKAELDRLVAKKYLPENLAKILYLEELDTFLESDLFQEIQGAARIIREQRFNLLLSPKNFTQDTEFSKKLTDEKLAVQGVIDLILIGQNGEISLFDYKTDRLSAKELSDPTLAQKKLQKDHGLQLSYYAHAIEELFCRPCKKVCIYSTHAGKLCDITPTPLTFSSDLIDKL